MVSGMEGVGVLFRKKVKIEFTTGVVVALPTPRTKGCI